jgi:DNA-binding transcriptional MerR regulator
MKWYVKEFAKLTKLSVRTLHHYDDIGLLKPSLRTPAGYRLYSENDLIKLVKVLWSEFETN